METALTATYAEKGNGRRPLRPKSYLEVTQKTTPYMLIHPRLARLRQSRLSFYAAVYGVRPKRPYTSMYCRS